MPYKHKPGKGKVRKHRKNKQFRRKNGNKGTTMVLRNINGSVFPDRLYTKLRLCIPLYTTVATGGGGSGVVHTFTCLANSLHSVGFNIDNTGFTGNEYTGVYFLLSNNSTGGSNAPYGLYRVLSSKAALSVMPANGQTVALNVAFGPTMTQTPTVAFGNFAEEPYITTWVVPPSQTVVAKKIKKYMSTQKMFGLKYKSTVEDNNYAALSGSNPASLWYWVCMIQASDGATAWTGEIKIEIEAYVEFFGRNTYASTNI